MVNHKKLMAATFLMASLLSFLSCGTPMDILGRGAKTTCLSLTTDQMMIKCDCTGKQIVSVTIYKNKTSDELFEKMITERTFKKPVSIVKLPISNDSANNMYLNIEIHLTNSHFRESYYFKTKPGDYSKKKTLYSRYFSH
jgi:hypothetical protein